MSPQAELQIIARMQDQATRGLESLQHSLSGVAKQAAGFGLGMVGVQAAGGLFNMLKEAVVGFNASMEQSKVAWSTMLGSTAAADAMLKDLQQFAATTPFEFPDLERSSKKLLAMGFAAKDIIPLMTDIGNATSALGMSAQGIERITLALGQMRAKGKVGGDDMRQLAEAGIPAWRMLATQIGKSIPETMKLSENGEIAAGTFIKAFQTFSQQNWGGMMDKQSKTFIGSISTITDNLRLAASSAFRPLFERISDLALAISNFVQSNQFAEWAQRISTVVSSLLIKLQDMPDNVRGAAIVFGIVTVAGAALAVVLGLVGAAMAVVLSPIGAVVAAAALLAVAWQTNFLGIRDIAAKVLPAIASFVYEKIGGLLDWWNENLPSLQKTVQTVLGWIEGFWKGHGETILRIVGRIWDFIGRVVGRAVDTLSDVISVAMNLIQGNWAEAWNGVMRIVGRAWESIIDALGTGAKIVIDIVGSVAKAFGKEDLTAGWADAVDKVMAMGKGLTAGMGSVAPVLGKMNSMMEENFATTKRGADTVKDFAAGLFDNLIPGLNNATDDGLALAMATDKGRTAMLGAGKTGSELGDELGKVKEKAQDLGVSVGQLIPALVSLSPATAMAAARVAVWEQRIRDVNLAIVANRDQLKAAQAEYGHMSERLGELNRQLSEAKSRLSELSSPKLAGMGQFGVQIAAVQDALKRMDLAETLGAPFADILQQYPLLTKGAMEYLATLPQTREGLQAALKYLQDLQAVKYDEQLRLLGEAAKDSAKEMTFSDALKAIQDTKSQIGGLTGAISAQEAAIRSQQDAINSIQAAAEALNATLANYQAQLQAAQANQQLVTQSLTMAFTWLLQDRDKFTELGAEGERVAGVMDAKTMELLTSITGAASDTTGISSATLAEMVKNYQTDMARALLEIGKVQGALASIPRDIKTVHTTYHQDVYLGAVGAAGETVPEARQGGGPVSAGRPYIVGEHGIELFVPGMSGAIVPVAGPMPLSMSGGTGGGNVYVTVIVQGSVTAERDLAEKIRRELLYVGGRNSNIFGGLA